METDYHVFTISQFTVAISPDERVFVLWDGGTLEHQDRHRENIRFQGF